MTHFSAQCHPVYLQGFVGHPFDWLFSNLVLCPALGGITTLMIKAQTCFYLSGLWPERQTTRFLEWPLTLPGIELTIKTDFVIHLIVLMFFFDITGF